MKIRALAALVSFFFTPCVLQAQDSAGRTNAWISLGMGAAIPSSGGDGIANMAQLGVERGAHRVTLRGLILHDIDRDTNEIGEVGALYSRSRKSGSNNLSIGTGLSMVGFDTCPDDDDSCFTPGVPIVAEAARSRGILGAGVQVFANLNAKASYAGAVVFIALGRLPR